MEGSLEEGTHDEHHDGKTPHKATRCEHICTSVILSVLGSIFIGLILLTIPSAVGAIAMRNQEFSDTAERQCKILSMKVHEGYCEYAGKGSCCVAQAEVQVVGQTRSATALQFRGPAASETRECAEAQGFASRFAVGGTVACYQFVDGTGEIKLDSDTPPSSYTSGVIAGAVVGFGFVVPCVLGLACCFFGFAFQQCLMLCSDEDNGEESESSLIE
ncbi:unnamed protein product [Polarella glacialis]|uniref:Uncharacterized protein n=1 Tax=Polarella glacialis TaxID=89957 RepID=A0A813IJ02_POLGL|nr:unnamed protein product [Polarella glacialis]CAE8650171.1 unnamed protein product [Polarella glacialis]